MSSKEEKRNMEEIKVYMNKELLDVILFCCMLLSMLLVLARAANVNKNHDILLEAILRYRQHCIMIASVPMVSYDNLDDVIAVTRRFFLFWDWGYEHYLPPYQYRLIKPYIVDKRKEKKK